LSHTTIIRPARLEEAGALTALCVRSKAHWGYDDAFMAKAMSELTVRPEWIADGLVLVAETGGTVAGVAGITDEGAGTFDVSVFFVDPDRMGDGIGRRLFGAICDLARASGARRLTILSDPNAERFYRCMGAKRIGEERSSSETGRVLPLLDYAL
jgi:GNAT superfamily N-acetyltransferase